MEHRSWIEFATLETVIEPIIPIQLTIDDKESLPENNQDCVLIHPRPRTELPVAKRQRKVPLPLARGSTSNIELLRRLCVALESGTKGGTTFFNKKAKHLFPVEFKSIMEAKIENKMVNPRVIVCTFALDNLVEEGLLRRVSTSNKGKGEAVRTFNKWEVV